MPSFNRAPSCMLQAVLAQGSLSPLLSLRDRKVAGGHLNVRLRIDNQVHVYCGLTRLVVVTLKTTGTIRVDASKSYSEEECAKEFFGLWQKDQINGQEFERRLRGYLESVVVDSRWVPFDRESVVGYASPPERQRPRSLGAVAEARDRVDAFRKSEKWAKLPERGKEFDQLAVNPYGHLVVIELKDASTRDVYYAPLQLLQYVWEWQSAFEAVRDAVQNLLDVRIAMEF